MINVYARPISANGLLPAAHPTHLVAQKIAVRDLMMVAGELTAAEAAIQVILATIAEAAMEHA